MADQNETPQADNPANASGDTHPLPGAGGDQIADRRAKLARLRNELGVDPYGGREDELVCLADARASYDDVADESHKAAPEADERPVLKVAGRIVLHRDIGKLVFMTLRDDTGDLQVAISKKSVDETSFKIAKLVDLGDIIVVEGPIGTTKTGEITIWAAGEGVVKMACKSLAVPPEKWSGLSDPELRYRQRYVDLYANPEVMRLMQLRIRIIDEMRAYFRGRGFVEVETPMLQPIHGGAAARPFITHHNALDMRLFMRIAPELYLKRLLVGGMSKVFEINRNFRNEGISPRHNPEFTMVEAYEAFGSWQTMADLVEDMVCTIAETVLGTLQIEHKNADGEVTKTIDLTRPWRRVRMDELVEERTGWKFDKQRASVDVVRCIFDGMELRISRQYARQLRLTSPALSERLLAVDSLDELRDELDGILDLIKDEHVHIKARMAEIEANLDGTDDVEFRRLSASIAALGDLQRDYLLFKSGESEMKRRLDAFSYEFMQLSPAEQLTEVYEKLIEHTLIDPTFVTHVPSVVIPLARENRDDPFFADVYELAINGQEISPGYTELNDPEVQEAHFRGQVGDREEQQQVDEDFLNALRVGMPPAGGMGMGVDRLIMMLTGAESIRDVVLFPLMRQKED